ncbi:hypothetical protein ACLI1A_15535 [Flavobacterium sp. RHBU_3]|uniref:hypothetical protein n=1 Tax=Flavobacterium sp. RHBU_3 TaxID=3391184 RepID=UPI0039846579
MKRYIIKSFLFVLGVVSLSSCESFENDTLSTSYAYAGFNDEMANLPVFESGSENTVLVEVGVTNKVNYDRTFTIELDETLTTATPDQYTIDPVMVIPAGEYVGTLKIVGNYSALPEVDKRLLSINLVSVQDADSYNDEMQNVAVYIFRGCIITAEGDYSAVASGGGATSSFTPTLTRASDVVGINSFTTLSLWGDLVAELAGSTYAGQYQYPGLITINCDGSVDVEGTNSSLDTGSGSGTYDFDSGVITITFDNKLFTSSFDTTTVFTPAE